MLLLVPLLSLQAVCQNGVIATEFSRIAGVDRPASLTCADLEAAPRWPEQQEQPPLSPRAAIAAAKAALRTLVDDPAQWDFGAVELRPMVVQETWIYVVQFWHRPTGAFGGLSESLRIPVLMDGRVITPVRR